MDYFDKKVGPFLKTLGFKFDDQFQWVLGKDENITVYGDKVSMDIWLSSLYNHKSDFEKRTVNIEEGKKFLKENIKELKQLEKDPNNKKLGNALSKKLRALEEVDDERTRKSKSLRFKNMWLHYNFSKPAKATKGILYSVDVKDMQQLNKDALAIVSPILKAQKFKIVDTGFNDGISYYEPVNKKESKKIPYVKDLIDSQDEDDLDWGGIEMAGIIVNCYKGKYKGVGKDASLYYFVLMIGGFTVDDTEDPTVAVEVITPLDKGEQFFLDEVKKAVSKLDVWKFTGRAIKVNKCSKAVTGSVESKQFYYKGQTITASCKEEAIKQIIAKTGDFKVGEKVTVSLETLYKETKKHKTAFGYTIDTSEKGYYDLKDKFGNTVCMDGETCEVKTISGLGDLILINRDGDEETTFTLSKKEADTCIF